MAISHCQITSPCLCTLSTTSEAPRHKCPRSVSEAPQPPPTRPPRSERPTRSRRRQWCPLSGDQRQGAPHPATVRQRGRTAEDGRRQTGAENPGWADTWQFIRQQQYRGIGAAGPFRGVDNPPFYIPDHIFLILCHVSSSNALDEGQVVVDRWMLAKSPPPPHTHTQAHKTRQRWPSPG